VSGAAKTVLAANAESLAENCCSERCAHPRKTNDDAIKEPSRMKEVMVAA
jgi:hypothetical protein